MCHIMCNLHLCPPVESIKYFTTEEMFSCDKRTLPAEVFGSITVKYLYRRHFQAFSEKKHMAMKSFSMKQTFVSVCVLYMPTMCTFAGSG